MKTHFAFAVSVFCFCFASYGEDFPMTFKFKDYPKAAPEINPYQNPKNPYLKAIYTKPYTSKALLPVKFNKIRGLKPLPICKNGKPMLKIIIPPNQPYYKECAEELKYFMDIATGASFKIITDPGNLDEYGIYLGPLKNAKSKMLAKQTAKGKFDNFMIYRTAKGVLIVGKDADPKFNMKKNLKANQKEIRMTSIFYSRGTFMGCRDFLERFMGMRSYLPNRGGTYIPDYRKITISVPAVYYKDSPVYSFRSLDNSVNYAYDKGAVKATYREGRYWAARLRRGLTNNNMANHTDTEWHKVYLSKPHYFAMRKDGTRMIGKKGQQSSQRCYSNEEGFQQHIKDIDNWYKYGDRTGKEYIPFGRHWSCPNDKYIFWMPNDGFPGCYCPDCKKLQKKYGNIIRPRTVQELTYLIKLAKEVKKRWPDKQVIYSLYGLTHIPKVFLKDLPGNITYNKVFNGYPETFWKEKKYYDYATNYMKDLNKISKDKVIVYSHYPAKPRMINNLDIPYMVPKTVTKFYREMVDYIDGTHYCNGPWLVTIYDTYMINLLYALLWNPEINPDEYLAEFCSLYFGPADKEMKAYHDLLIKSWEDSKMSYTPDVVGFAGKGITWTNPNENYWKDSYTTSMRAKMKKLLRKALSKTKAPSVYHERVQWYNHRAELFFKQGKMADSSLIVSADCPKAEGQIIIDGNLDDWKNKKSLLFLDNKTGKLAKNVKTDIFVSYDKNNLYIAGKVYEKNKMRLSKSKLGKDGKVTDYDSIEIYLCPPKLGDSDAGFNQRERFYRLAFNANGDILDTRRPVYAKKIKKNFTLKFQKKIKKMGKGFIFEFKIPFKSISALQPSPKTPWAMNIYRHRKRNDGSSAVYAWAPTLGDKLSNSYMFGTLNFPGKTIFDVPSKVSSTWDIFVTKAKNTRYTDSYKDGASTMKVSFGKENPKPIYIGWHFKGTYKKIDVPITASTQIKFKGTGVKFLQFFLRDKTGNQMRFKYVPKSSDKWKNLKMDLVTYVRGKRSDLSPTMEKLNDFYGAGLTARIEPGANFTIEMKDIKGVER